MKQIKHSSKYQIDRLIREDVGGVDSGNLYKTQSRAAWRNYVFFDAWILVLGLVHGEFSWAAGSAVILLNGSTLHYLCGRQRVMDEVQGSNKRGGEKHLHAHDKASHKEEACFFEQGPCSAHMVLINSSRPAFCKFPERPVLKQIWSGYYTADDKSSFFTNCVRLLMIMNGMLFFVLTSVC